MANFEQYFNYMNVFVYHMKLSDNRFEVEHKHPNRYQMKLYDRSQTQNFIHATFKLYNANIVQTSAGKHNTP